MDSEVKRYPAVLHALTDPDRRAKMEAICASLNAEIHTIDEQLEPVKKNLLGMVRYGVFGPTLDVCRKWLEATSYG